jgi:hypothetical protein
MKNIISYLMFFGVSIAFAQEQQPVPPIPADTSVWKHAVIVSANLTQVSFVDWAQGGENALAYALFLEGKSTYAAGLIEWMNGYKFGYGQAKIGSQGVRKTDDKIDLESVLTYKIGTYINPFASASLKTQFSKGVMYDAAGVATPVSNFFDPAYLTQTVGVGYQPVPEVKTRLGLGLREIIADKYALGYIGDSTKTVKVDGGIESVTDIGWTVMENVVFNAKLEIFAPLKNLDRMTVRSDNTLSAKVNKYIAMNLNVQLLNDPQVQTRTQIKQTLALGISYTLL